MAIDNAKILNVRIKNKYDSYENWINSGLILEAGEIAIAHTTIDVAVENGTVKHPGLLMKVGDGEKTFSALPWLSAKAADVLSVCKNETDLKEFIKTVISADDGALKNLETALKALITKEETRALAAEAKLAQDILAVDEKVNELARIEAEGKAALTKALNEETAARKEDKQELVKALEETRNTVAANKAELAQDIAEAEAAAKQHADDLNAAMNDRMADVEGLLGLGEEATGKTVAEQIAEAVQVVQDEVDALEQTHATDKAELVKAIEDEAQTREEAVQGVQDAVDELAGTHATDKAALEAAIALKADQTALDAVSAVANAAATKEEFDAAVEALEAEDARIEGLVTAEAAKAREEEGKLDARLVEVETFFKTAEGQTLDEALDTLVELQKYLEEEGAVADQMILDIAANATAIEEMDEAYKAADEDLQDAIDAVEGRMDTAEGDIDALEGRMTTAEADIDAVEGRMTTAEGAITALQQAVGEGGSVDAQIDAKIAALDADVTSAAVEEGKGVQVNVKEVDGKVTEVVVTGNFDNAYDAKGAAAAAQAAAEATAAADATAKDEALEAKIKEYVDAEDAKIEKSVEDLTAVVNTKAAQADLETLAGRVTTAEGEIDTLQTEMDAVEALAAANKTATETNAAAIATKAAQTDLQAEIDRATAKEAELAAAINAYVECSEEEIVALFN